MLPLNGTGELEGNQTYGTNWENDTQVEYNKTDPFKPRVYKKSSGNELFSIRTQPSNFSSGTCPFTAFWTFDESGAKAWDHCGQHDGSKNNFDGDEQGSSGLVGDSYDFDGSSDYLQITDEDSLNVSDKVTFAAWIYPRDMSNTAQGVYDDWDGNDRTFALHNDAGTLAFWIHPGDTGGGTKYSGPSLTQNEWQCVAATFDPSNDALEFYKNGTNTDSKSPTESPTDAQNDWTIGLDGTGGSNNFDGRIDSLRVYNRVLSSEEVSALCGLNSQLTDLPSAPNVTLDSPADGTSTSSPVDFKYNITFFGGLDKTELWYNLSEYTGNKETPVVADSGQNITYQDKHGTGADNRLIGDTDDGTGNNEHTRSVIADNGKSAFLFTKNDSDQKNVAVHNLTSTISSSNRKTCSKNPIIDVSANTWRDSEVAVTDAYYNSSENTWHVLLEGEDSNGVFSIGYANLTGADNPCSNNWNLYHGNPVFDTSNSESWDSANAIDGARAKGPNGSIHMVYSADSGGGLTNDAQIGIANYTGSGHPWINWERWKAANPVIKINNDVHWRNRSLFGSTMFFYDDARGEYILGFHGKDDDETNAGLSSDICITNSTDLSTWWVEQTVDTTAMTDHCQNTEKDRETWFNDTRDWEGDGDSNGPEVEFPSYLQWDDSHYVAYSAYDSKSIGFANVSANKSIVTWKGRKTNQSKVTNNTVNTISDSLSDGTYKWNIKAHQDDGQTAFYKQNWTVTVSGNSAPSISNLAASPDPVDTGSTVNITADITDDGTLDQTLCTLKDADGNIELDNVSMSTTSSDTYFCTTTPTEEPSNIGTWDIIIHANDSEGASSSSTSTFTVNDRTPPQWRKLNDNSSTTEPGDVVNISADSKDDGSGLWKTVIATNETGKWVNWTTLPDQFEGTFEESNDSWQGYNLSVTPVEYGRTSGGTEGDYSYKVYTYPADGDGYDCGSKDCELVVNKSLDMAGWNWLNTSYIHVEQWGNGCQWHEFYVNNTRMFYDRDGSSNSNEEIVVDVSGYESETPVKWVNNVTCDYTNHSSTHSRFKFDEFRLFNNETTKYGSPDEKSNSSEQFINTWFNWSRDDFNGVLGYKLWGKDASGNWNSTQTGTFISTSTPKYTDQEIIWNNIGGSETKQVENTIDDKGDADIDSHNTPPSGSEGKFTNSTLQIDGWTSPFDWTATVSDWFGRTSTGYDVNFTATA